MKKLFLLTLAVGAFGAAHGATFTLSDGNSTVVGNDVTGLNDWFIDGVDHLFREDYFWRIGNTPEQSQGALGPGVITNIAANYSRVTFNNPGLFTISVDYILGGSTPGSGTADIAEIVRITNHASFALPLTLFQYNDFDLNGTPFDQGASFDGHFFQWDNPVYGMVGTVDYADRWEINTYPNLLNKLSDANVDNLANAVTPVGGGDIECASQWNLNLAAANAAGGPTAPGSTWVMSTNKRIVTVPEPATMAALGLGLAAMARRRRK